MHLRYAIFLAIAAGLFYSTCAGSRLPGPQPSSLSVSDNGRYLVDAQGHPFFWLGDTGWLLLTKLTREEAEAYLDDRQRKGFNVIQVMLLHDRQRAVNVYGDSAFVNRDISRPLVSPGTAFRKPAAYDFWDHVDFVVTAAARRGLYMALVPVWGSNVKGGDISAEQASQYATWLAKRYRSYDNVIWLNGGDIIGTDALMVWQAIGRALHQTDPAKLITFHPRGRTQSSMWFQDAPWLDFHMFQSGHRRYDQDDTELAYGEDNWRYVDADYRLRPVRPTIDGEPSYEGIPQGLHDTLQPYWDEADVRRYAYWSVFAGAFGHTYGHSAVMQFYRPGDSPDYGARQYWSQALGAPGAGQLQHLKQLMLSRPYLERVPDQGLIAQQPGARYDHLLATRGQAYAFVYTFTGQPLRISMGRISGKRVRASWYDPRTGSSREIGTFDNAGTHTFDPPGEPARGNDWVLMLDRADG